jgi:hypothetical protein
LKHKGTKNTKGTAQVLVFFVFFVSLWFTCFRVYSQAIDVTPYVLPLNAANRGAEIAEVHAAFDLDPDVADFGGKKIPAVWRSNGLVTGMMGIMRFGPAVAAYVCWKKGNAEFCPPFTEGAGGARMTRMQSDAVTVEYSPFPGVQVTQTMLAVNARLFRSRAVVSGPAAQGVTAGLMGGVVEQNETGHLKDFQRSPAKDLSHDGVSYVWRMSNPGGDLKVTEFSLSFGSDTKAAERPFDELLAERRKQSEIAYAAVPKFDFHDAQLNLFHRIMWERLRGLAENASGSIPFSYFMGTSAPWGIDGLWLWDAAFVSQVLRYSDSDWASRMLEAVLFQQNPATGLVPHWSTPRSRTEISQPPLLSWAALRLYTNDGGKAFLERAYPRLAALHRWFIKNRTRPDGLPFWKQPDESGMDNSPAFDDNTDAHVDLVAELFADAGCLAEIAGILGKEDDRREWQQQEQTWRKRMSRYWDAEGQFYFPLKGEKRLPVYGVQGFFPLWDPQLPADRRAALLARLKDPAEFWTQFPVPSVSLKSPQFMQPKWFANTYGSPETGQRIGDRLVDYTSVYWRGPVWVFSNAIIYEGLRRSGEFPTANALGERMVHMMFEAAKHGGMLWENFDPRDGAPSRLLPKGQADEMAASIYFLKALYDSHVGLEAVEAPTYKQLHLRYTAAPKADVTGLRFGSWTIAQKVNGKDVEITVLRAPNKDATITVDDQSGQGLRVKTKR